LEIERRKLLEIAEQQRAIAIAEQSRAQSEAQAQAEVARAKATAAEEKVFSAREIEIAERQKRIELVRAAQDAERDAIRIKVAAEAEKSAATDRADAQRTEAEGIADADKIRALVAKLSLRDRRRRNPPDERGAERALTCLARLQRPHAAH